LLPLPAALSPNEIVILVIPVAVAVDDDDDSGNAKLDDRIAPLDVMSDIVAPRIARPC
jgi:hypothetical protein